MINKKTKWLFFSGTMQKGYLAAEGLKRIFHVEVAVKNKKFIKALGGIFFKKVA